ncbi:grasp-with-spasm system SPASM domain peptide maturase [Chryseobacterium wanjuense]
MTYFNLFSNILIAKGANRILISDLQRNISELYPLELNDLIEELKVHSVEEVMQLYDNESKELLQKYLDFLIEKEYGFITRNNWDKNFPSFSKEFHDYSIISNIFLELDSLTVLDKIKSCIESLGIKHIVIYCKRILSFDEIVEIDKKFKNSSLESIEIFLKFDNSINKKLIQKLNQNTQRIHSIIFYNCKKIPFKINDEFKFIVNFTQQDLKISSCGKINLDYFNTNLSKSLRSL